MQIENIFTTLEYAQVENDTNFNIRIPCIGKTKLDENRKAIPNVKASISLSIICR